MVYRLRWLDWRQIAQVLEEGRVLYIKPYQYHIPKIKLDWEVCKKATKGHTNMQAKLVLCNPNNLPPEVTSSIGTIAARPRSTWEVDTSKDIDYNVDGYWTREPALI